VGATSGDTGSAAIDAVAGRAKVDIFMLHPKGRVSDVQRRQMTTVLAPNVHNIAIDGSFDDAQAMVKRMFNDKAVTGQFNIGAVNSINWARLMAQVVYYFAAALQLGAPHRKVAFSVPTGNFGDVFAGYVAAKMGLPIEKLIVATNVNDILHRALSTGDYSAGTVTPTAAPSMDIQVSSNFERLLFDLGGRDGAALAEQMAGFEATKAMQLTNAQREGAADLFTSARVDADQMAEAMRWGWEATGELLDPHTAIGCMPPAPGIAADVPVVTLATAHPAKFPDAVERATGRRPGLPARVGDLFEREERSPTCPATMTPWPPMWPSTPPQGIMAELILQPQLLLGEGWGDYGLVDRAMDASWSAMAPIASSAPNRRPCGSRAPRTGTPTANSCPARTRMAAAAGPTPSRSPRRLAAGWPNGVRFTAQCTPFRHLGFFPDMAPVWDWMGSMLGGKAEASCSTCSAIPASARWL
jgi:threonine synthase